MFSTQNAVWVGLLQVAVIVGGVLGAGLSRAVLAKLRPAQTVSLALQALELWGWALLPLPLVWLWLALRIRRRTEVSERTKQTVFWGGLVLAVLILAGAVGLSVQPWCVPAPANESVEAVEAD